jgi:hypoxanthine phosphoribosyltransferase
MSVNGERQRGDVIYPEKQVVRRISELANELSPLIKAEDAVLVPLFRGAKEFHDEFKRHLKLAHDLDPPSLPMKVSRYDSGEARTPRIEKDVDPKAIEDQAALILDEIIEDGESVDTAEQSLIEKRARKIVRVVLVKRKSGSGRVDVAGFEYEGHEWVEGWGADDGLGEGRARRDIIVSFRQPSDLAA